MVWLPLLHGPPALTIGARFSILSATGRQRPVLLMSRSYYEVPRDVLTVKDSTFEKTACADGASRLRVCSGLETWLLCTSWP
jgi:hypothetical protein